MLYREIMAVCSQIHTKHINTAVWGERRIVECVGLTTLAALCASGTHRVCPDPKWVSISAKYEGRASFIFGI